MKRQLHLRNGSTLLIMFRKVQFKMFREPRIYHSLYTIGPFVKNIMLNSIRKTISTTLISSAISSR